MTAAAPTPSPAPTPDELKGHLDALILATLNHGGPSHGYAIIEQLRLRTSGALDLPEGTVYPALHRLERGGLISSEWDTSSGRRRRVYSLTRRGTADLQARRQRWADFKQTIEAVLAV